MTCGGESKKEKKLSTGNSEARWLISYYDFRMGCDPPPPSTFFLNEEGGGGGVTPYSEILVRDESPTYFLDQ